METELTLGLVPLARTTFDIPLATEVAAQARARLAGAGFTLTGPAALVATLEEAGCAAQALAASPPDLLVVLQATFADSTMVMCLAEAVDAPLLLWAIPEDRAGGRLRLNSLCGVNLAAHALKRAGHRYHHLYAPPDDERAVVQMRTLALAGRARRRLRQARIGRIGEHPAGFEPCSLNRAALQARLGVEIVPVTLPDLFSRIRAVAPHEVDETLARLSQRVDGLAGLDQPALRGTLAAYHALRDLAAQERLDGLAVRCWPEFFTELGCAACGAMSMLSDEGTPCSCEADVHGTITQLILQWISGEPAFGTDLVSVDVAGDVAVLWHCGLAPLSMADPAGRPRGTIHSNRRLPLLMEFPLRPGRVTLARLNETLGDYRLVVGGGEMLRAPLSFSGTSGVLRFDRPATQVLDTILSEGLDHHLSLTYGDHRPALLALAAMWDLPVLQL